MNKKFVQARRLNVNYLLTFSGACFMFFINCGKKKVQSQQAIQFLCRIVTQTQIQIFNFNF